MTRDDPPADSGAAARLAAIGAATAGAAHDFNNVLSGIGAAADLALARPALDPAVREELEEIRRGVARGAALVRRLLADGTRPPRPVRPRPLDPLLGAAAEVIRRLLPPGVRFVLRPGTAGCRVRVDPDRLHHALLNLAANAADAMRAEGGTLTLRSAVHVLRGPEPAEPVPPGSYAMITLRDTGPGIPPEVADRLFSPFVTTKPTGTGLGLVSVRETLRAAGGDVVLVTQQGHGTEVRLFIPLVDPQPARPAAPVLLVEDEPALCRLAARALRGAGWRVRTTGSAEAALALARSLPRPALLLCDLTLPGLDGAGLLRALRARWPALPAVMMSGYAETALPPELGEVAFLRKPFALADLLARVEAAAELPKCSCNPMESET
jgi:CheY-like chemotaxis protein